LFYGAMSFYIWSWSGFDKNYLRIDSCLDIGGSWNYDQQACQGEGGIIIKI
jgi:hypothetical protein